MNRKMPRLQMNKLRILRFMVPMRDETPWGLSMNHRFFLVVVLVLVIDWVACLRGRARGRARGRVGSGSQCMRKNERGLSMSGPMLRQVLDCTSLLALSIG